VGVPARVRVILFSRRLVDCQQCSWQVAPGLFRSGPPRVGFGYFSSPPVCARANKISLLSIRLIPVFVECKVVSTPRWASPKKKKMNKRKVVSDTRGLKAVVADCTIHPLKHGAIQRAGLLRHCAGGGAELERRRERTVERNVKGGLESRTARVRVILFSRRLWSVNSALAGGAQSFQIEASSRRMAKVIINPGVHLELRICLSLNFNASLGNTTTEIPSKQTLQAK